MKYFDTPTGIQKKRELTNRLILGIFAFILFMIGDWLLDMKSVGNVTTGIVESDWVSMSMWRFEASILLAAAAMPFYWVGIHAAKEIVTEGLRNGTKWDKRMSKMFCIGANAGLISFLFIHIMCCLFPIVFKCIYAETGDSLMATNLVNRSAAYIMLPFAAYYAVADGCISAGWIYMAWTGKLKLKKWQVLFCPLCTLLIGFVFNLIPVLKLITGAFESLGTLLIMCALCYSVRKAEPTR
ncbi:MAG: hypothetical protein LUG86_00560 [Oscillospiraceae bacterium]|nr:hypothetical protein [Oscillospiraceae bacterium]